MAIVPSLAFAGAATAQSGVSAVQAFGLIGTWAIDCAKPASRDNIQLNYAEANGAIVLSRSGGPDAKDSFQVRSAKLLAPDLIETVERDLGVPPADAAATEMTVVLRKVGDKIRVWKTSAAGMVLVDEGKVVGTGTAGMAMTRCK
jgi:hypothetical protein